MSNPRNRILASTALALVLAAPLGYLAKGHLTAMAATSAEPAAAQFAPAVAIRQKVADGDSVTGLPTLIRLLGTAGAGFGATTVNLKGGLGSASAVTRDGHTVGALAAVNACGSANVGRGPHFWAAPFEIDREFGGLGFPATLPPAALTPVAKGRPGENTTIAIVATDATLTKAQTKELAVMAQDGLARALYPAHTTLDGDTVFAVATGRRPLADAVNELTELGAVAANVLARAVARGVFEAKTLPGCPPSWRDCHSK